MTNARWRPQIIGEEPSMAGMLKALHARGAIAESRSLFEPGELNRVPFFISDLVNAATAKFGEYLRDPDFAAKRIIEGLACYKFEGMAVLGCDGVAMSEQGVISDTVVQITTWSPDSEVSQFLPHNSISLKRPLAVGRHIDHVPCFLGYSPAWRNFAHWLQESLPLVIGYLRLRNDIPDLHLIMPILRAGSFQQQTLDILGIEPGQVFAVPPDTALWVATGWIMTKPDLWTVPPAVVLAARHLVERSISADPYVAGRGDRIYIHRSSDIRSVKNFLDVKRLVEKFDFRIVCPEDLSLSQQIALMAQAQLVIGEHGAGLASIVFCKPGGTVLELFNEACPQPEFWSLASQAGLRFGYLVGIDVATPRAAAGDWNSSYIVNLDRLQTALELMTDIPEHLIGADSETLYSTPVSGGAAAMPLVDEDPQGSPRSLPAVSSKAWPIRGQLMVSDHNSKAIAAAERLAEDGDIEVVLHMLRRLPLMDFGLLLLAMPKAETPALSSLLPRMASAEVQMGWTGAHGFDLFRQTQDFVQRLQFQFQDILRRPLANSRILDFGVGWGRVIRPMLYFSSPDDLYGVDPWDRSLFECQATGVLAHLRQSSYLPDELPVDGVLFDLIYSYSVFTHTSLRATQAALRSLRKCIKQNGLLIITVRPAAFWTRDLWKSRTGFDLQTIMSEHHHAGFSFIGHADPIVDGDRVFGDTVISIDWFREHAKYWHVVGVDQGVDLDQLVILLAPS